MPAGPLLGRAIELLDLADLLSREDAPLITITGPGGVGKTALAVQAGTRAADRFPDGVDFVRLEAIRDPAQVLPAIAHAIGLRESGAGGDLRDDLARTIEHQQRLFILDNVEQISADPAAGGRLAAELRHLMTARGVKLLATSRTPLGVYGEREYPLDPLPVPERFDERRYRQLLENPSVRLFVDRATAVSPRFALSPENASAILEICRRLDGLPLAIELAAARVKLLPPAALLSRLSSQLQVLTGGPRDRPARQQTMRDAIAWSYDLLSPERRMLFRRLGVFAGGFTLDAAEWVMGHGAWGMEGDGAVHPPSPIPHDPSPITLDGIAELVDQSLVRRIGRDGDEPRFGMFQTIDEFAWEQLAASGETDAIQRAHAGWVAGLVAQAEPGMVGPDQARWFARLDSEHDNIRAALDWALSAGEAELAQRIAGPLWRFWWTRGRFTEGRLWLDRALSADVSARPSAARAYALLGAGQLTEDMGDYERCTALYRSALETARAVGERGLAAKSVNALANVAHGRGNYDEATELHQEATRLFTELNDRRGMAASLHNLGTVHFYRGDFAAARDLYSRAFELLEQIGDKQSAGMILAHLGAIARTTGDLDQAIAQQTRSLEILRALGDGSAIGNVLINLGDSLRAAGDFASARTRLDEAKELFERTGVKRGAAAADFYLALIEDAHGELAAAADRLARSAAIFREVDDLRYLLFNYESIASVALQLGAPRMAARMLGAAEALRRALGTEPQPDEAEELAASRDRARQALGEAAYAAERDAGASATSASLVAEAGKLSQLAAAGGEEIDGAARRAGLKRRELEVLTLLAAGKSYQQVADALGIGVPLVTATVGSLYAKLAVDSRAGLTAFAFKHGLV